MAVHLSEANVSKPADLLAQSGEPIGLVVFDPTDLAAKALVEVARMGKIVKVFYPVFPPQDNAADVIAWLREAASKAKAG